MSKPAWNVGTKVLTKKKPNGDALANKDPSKIAKKPAVPIQPKKTADATVCIALIAS